jgi:hypothetical protein
MTKSKKLSADPWLGDDSGSWLRTRKKIKEVEQRQILMSALGPPRKKGGNSLAELKILREEMERVAEETSTLAQTKRQLSRLRAGHAISTGDTAMEADPMSPQSTVNLAMPVAAPIVAPMTVPSAASVKEQAARMTVMSLFRGDGDTTKSWNNLPVATATTPKYVGVPQECTLMHRSGSSGSTRPRLTATNPKRGANRLPPPSDAPGLQLWACSDSGSVRMQTQATNRIRQPSRRQTPNGGLGRSTRMVGGNRAVGDPNTLSSGETQQPLGFDADSLSKSYSKPLPWSATRYDPVCARWVAIDRPISPLGKRSSSPRKNGHGNDADRDRGVRPVRSLPALLLSSYGYAAPAPVIINFPPSSRPTTSTSTSISRPTTSTASTHDRGAWLQSNSNAEC